MGDPALEAFFGNPESVAQLGGALQQASSGLQQLRQTLDRQVSSLVPGTWSGQTASAFRQHWQGRSDAVNRTAEQARQTSSTMQTLASELRTAKSQFQLAEEQAAANGMYITPAFVVVPYDWTDPRVTALPWVQSQVSPAVGMAETARVQARAELSVVGTPASLGLLKDVAQGAIQWVGGLVQGVERLGNTLVQLDPVHAVADPKGYLQELESAGKGVQNGIGTLGKAAWGVLEMSARLSPERLEADPEGFQQDAQAYAAALGRPGDLVRNGTKVVLTLGSAYLLGGGATAGARATAEVEATAGAETVAAADGTAVATAARADRISAASDAAASESGWTRQTGAAGEAARLKGLEQQGETAVDLNTLPSVGDGKNFPTLDNVSGAGFESVKTKLGPTGSEFSPELSPSRLNAYKNDFVTLTSEDGASAAADELVDPANADALQQLQQRGAWPGDLPADANVDQVGSYIRQNGRLAVPDDHVAQVQAAARSQVELDPEAFGLPPNPSTAQVDQVVGRVQSIGVSSSDINGILPPRRGAAPAGP